MYQLGYVFSGIIIAWISDHCGRKFALQISIAFELLGGLLLILSPSIHLYTLARLILGFGDSGRGMCLYMLLMETVNFLYVNFTRLIVPEYNRWEPKEDQT